MKAGRVLRRSNETDSSWSMLRRFSSLLALVWLFFGVVVMPAAAYACGHSDVHASEILAVDAVADTDHSQGKSGDTDMPCHAIGHHHCNAAMHLDTPRIAVAWLPKSLLARPKALMALASHSQAPPLEPPTA